MPEPVLLLGSQRSGTTALARVLADEFAGQGGIFTVNGKLPYVLGRWLTAMDLKHRHVRVDEMIHALKRLPPRGPGADTWLLRVESVLRAVAAEVAGGAGDDRLAVGRRIMSESYDFAARWGDKYNEYMLELPHLHELVPQARLLVLVRHPAEVASSMLEWGGDRPWRPSSRADSMAKWVLWNEEWLSFKRANPGLPCLVVDYRSLCLSHDTQQSVADFCDVSAAAIRSGLSIRRAVTGNGAPLPTEVAGTWNRLTEQL